MVDLVAQWLKHEAQAAMVNCHDGQGSNPELVVLSFFKFYTHFLIISLSLC